MIAAFLCVFVFLAFLAFPAFSAFADDKSDEVNKTFRIDEKKVNYLQGNYDAEFSSNVNLKMKIPDDDVIYFDEEDAKTVYTMEYTLDLKNTELYYIKDKCFSEFYWDFYRVDVDDTGVASNVTLLTRFMYLADYGVNKTHNLLYGYQCFAKKDYVYSAPAFSVTPDNKELFAIEYKYDPNHPTPMPPTSKKYTTVNLLKDLGVFDGWEVLGGRTIENVAGSHLNWDLSGSLPSMKFSITTTDPDTKYFCRFNYKVAEWARTQNFLGIGDKNYEKEVLFGGSPTNAAGTNGGTVQSPFASPYSILSDLRKSGDLEDTFTGREYEQAIEVLDKVEFKNITVERLVQIEDTPFATTKRDVVRVPVRSEGVFYENVCSALEVDSLAVLDAYPRKLLKLTSDGIYRVEYNHAAWFHATNADGYGMDLFLSINSSYADFYNHQAINTATDGTNNAIITNEMLEYFLNEIKREYPALEQYGSENIYGYWGFMAIPDTYTLDDVFQDVFGVATQYKGIAKYFRYKRKISVSAYNRLLDDYQYNWLAGLYHNVTAGALGYDATYYLVYMDNAGSSVISDNGSTDPEKNTGLIINKGQEFVQTALDWLGNLVKAPLAWMIVIGIVVLLVLMKAKSGGKKKR